MGRTETRDPSRRERLDLIRRRAGAEFVWGRRPVSVALLAATVEHVASRIDAAPSWLVEVSP